MDIRRVVLVALGLGAFSGCSEEYFRIETTWHADGQVDRAVYQPAEYFPEKDRKGWASVRTVAKIESSAFTDSIRDLPASTCKEPVYLAAWGRFDSPQSIPDHFRFGGADASKVGRLERSVSVNHLGLVTEYVWQETLTDAVSLADMQSARQETIDHVVGLVEATLDRGATKYDVSGLIEWLRTDAAAWFDESHALIVEAAIRRELHGEDDGKRLVTRLRANSAKYGLELPVSNEELIEGSEVDETVTGFLIAKVRETVRTSAGEPIDEQEALAILQQIGFTVDDDTLRWEPSDGWKRAVLQRFGSEEAAVAKRDELVTRLAGVYQAILLASPRPFHHELELPGIVVESTGTLTGAGQVAWRFDAREAFPLGYQMHARSLSADTQAQQRVLGGQRIAGLEELSEYVAIMRSDADLAAVMEEAVKVGSLDPLDAREADLAKQDNVEPQILARIRALRRLLEP